MCRRWWHLAARASLLMCALDAEALRGLPASGPRAAPGPQPYPFYPHGGTLWQDLYVDNFVDLGNGTTPLDFECTQHSYIGHGGHDSDISGFREQAIGVPIFAALDGTIVRTHDGEPDMNTQGGGLANYVIIDHGGGQRSLYWHLKKGSVGVAVGQNVVAGTQIGLTGSSGDSTWPHLHFESELNGVVYEPSAGPCRPGPSYWTAQVPTRHDLYSKGFTFGNGPFSGMAGFPWDQVARTGTYVLGTRQTYFRMELANVSANSTYRVQYRRPDGTTALDVTQPYGNSAEEREGWEWFQFTVPLTTTGTWTVDVAFNGVAVASAPFSVVASAADVVNRPPLAIALTLDPASPGAADVPFCRVQTSLYRRDPDYDLVRYEYRWAVNGAAVRTVISAGLADALPRGLARVGDVLTCMVTPYDEQVAGPPATIASVGDGDGDGLPDAWEQQFGLNPASAIGNDGTGGDPDGDGRTNLQEYTDGTHPQGFFTHYFAEGATSAFFDCAFALANPGAGSASVLLRFLKSDGTKAGHYVAVPASSRRTVSAKTVSGVSAAEFSTIIESDVLVVADRTMTWDAGGYGSHAETSVAAPATTWYLAEGATHSGFSLFYLVQNPTATDATLQVTYLLPPPAAPVIRTYTAPANSRFNIWVNQQGAALLATDVSAIVTSTNHVPVIVERAMYLNAGGLTFGAGHESAGVTAPATSWFLAEGATGPYFDLFVLVANPNATDAAVRATFLLPGGTTVTRDYTIAAWSRATIWVDIVDPQLASTAVSTTVTSTNGVGVIVERAMWWPGAVTTWQEAHDSPGSTETGTRWALAEGEVGGARNTVTYILIANTSAFGGSASVTLLFEDGPTATRTFALNPSSRFNVDVQAEFPGAAGKRFGAIVESLGEAPAQIVVERAMYSDAAGGPWSAGTNALAIRLP